MRRLERLWEGLKELPILENRNTRTGLKAFFYVKNWPEERVQMNTFFQFSVERRRDGQKLEFQQTKRDSEG